MNYSLDPLNGVKKLLTAEILSMIAAVCTLIGAIAAVLLVISYILYLVGLRNAGKQMMF